MHTTVDNDLHMSGQDHRLRLSSANPRLADLPADILLQIASYLNTFSDRLHLSATSHGIYPKVIPSIYAHVTLQGIPQCEATLAMLKASPGIARHIQSLVIRPDHRLHRRRQGYIRTWNYPHRASILVAEAAKQMDALRSFMWDGEDTLPDEKMWDELRKCCPNLKHVGVSFGSFLPNPHSHLFAFRDLEGFSLVLRDGFYVQQLHVPSRESEPVFHRFWTMLIKHSPNLKHLTITGDGSSSEPLDISPITSGSWPHLQSLNLGNVIVNANTASPNAPPPLVSFLDRHVHIKSLSLNGRQLPVFGNTSIGPVELALLDGKALPGLCEFNGSLDCLRALAGRGMNLPDDPNAPLQPQPQPQQQNGNETPIASSPLAYTLHTIRFPAPIQLRDLTPLAISSVLGSMHALRDLTIGFWLQSGYDSNGVLRTIVSSCPGLERLDLTCGCKPSFYLESFSRTLRALTKLTSLSLTIVKVPGDDPMHIGASRIALSNPRLHTFTITYLPSSPSPSTIPPSPSSESLDPFSPFGQTSFASLDTKYYSTEPVEVGHYELVCDAHGIPTSLICWERTRRTYFPSFSSLLPYLTIIPFDAFRLSALSLGFGTLVGIGGFGSFGGFTGFLARLSLIAWRSPLYPIGAPSLLLLPIPAPAILGAGGAALPIQIPAHHTHPFLPLAHPIPPLITLPTLHILNFFRTRQRCTSQKASGGLGRGKRWVLELRPSGHPDVAKKGWGEVLLEKGPAGEEARLLAFCAWLLLLAMWGVGRAVL